MKRPLLAALSGLLAILAILASSRVANADGDPATIMADGAKALRDGRASDAIGAFESLADLGVVDAVASYDRGLASAQRAAEETPQLHVTPWALTELIEAAVRTARADLAAGAFERVMAATAPSSTDWGRGMEARCRALLSEGESAQRLYREAIERLARTRRRPELARAHLLYGEWLRRENRRVDARVQLRAAHDQFAGAHRPGGPGID